ncbi:DUF2889 domain-containing protein, partial [Cupriavidus sp. amp6]|uniref:DUF2889 domain-containing protein n=1 Tax=Cupriavidus sp. amp6 TaxID=388051 RepID=UPI0035103D6C
MLLGSPVHPKRSSCARFIHALASGSKDGLIAPGQVAHKRLSQQSPLHRPSMQLYNGSTINTRAGAPMNNERVLLHTRQVQYRCYRRGDELWEIEGEMRDFRSYDTVVAEKGNLSA